MTLGLMLVGARPGLAQQRCAQPVAIFESVKNSVQLLQASTRAPQPAVRRLAVCPGETIHVGSNSRAVVLILASNTPLALDQNSEFVITPSANGTGSLIDLLRGALLFISRARQSLEIRTPFVNAAIEGTEFVIRVQTDRTVITVLEGAVRATNPLGTIVVGADQQAVAVQGQAPQLQVIVRPRDAVQWALYYEPLFPADSFAELAAIPEAARNAMYYVRRANLLLGAGQLEAARADLEEARNLDPASGDADALRAIVAVALNDIDEALETGRSAVKRAPGSPSAYLALSYALQANFQLEDARDAALQATAVAPTDGAAWARLAETRLMLDDVGGGVDAARQAATLSPKLARPQSVVGFAFLAQLNPSSARAAFERAIELEPDYPLGRLGLGLARIRQGRLAEGRSHLELAMALNPDNSLIRSYVGKAYFEERREPLPGEQFELAKQLDSRDPTPFFYDAIRKQTLNRSVEALRDMQQAIELNQNRAVYRSELRIEGDEAARNASLAHIYRDLGFEQLAFIEASKSLEVDMGDHSGHRFLAEAYSALPRHEVARVSEVLQAQLLQPTSLTSVPPRLAETDLFVLDGAGPDRVGFNEFNPLFNRNRVAVQFSGAAGGDGVLGDEATFSGIWNRLSLSIGQFHYRADGFRKNNRQERDLYNVFVQGQLSQSTMVQGEFRSEDVTTGDLVVNFDPADLSPLQLNQAKGTTKRVGLRHVFSPRSLIIASLYARNRDHRLAETHDEGGFITNVLASTLTDSWTAEARHVFRLPRITVTSGVGHFRSDRRRVSTIEIPDPDPALSFVFSEQSRDEPRQTNVYTYSLLDLPREVAVTIGASGDFYEKDLVVRNQFNPKFGLTWSPARATTVRVAAFRTLNRAVVSSQTIEPTQLAGFNQFFADSEGDQARRYGIGLDQKFSARVFGGVEYARRNLELPVVFASQFSRSVRLLEGLEDFARAYLYWAPTDHVSISSEYFFERFERDAASTVEAMFSQMQTHRFPVGARFFWESGLSARLKVTAINQTGLFFTKEARETGIPMEGKTMFGTVEGAIEYRIPRRYGRLVAEVKNVFDRQFNFQDVDPGNPTIRPGRLALFRLVIGG
jgi:tetratricopeptide (TPR) repeat protein